MDRGHSSQTSAMVFLFDDNNVQTGICAMIACLRPSPMPLFSNRSF